MTLDALAARASEAALEVFGIVDCTGDTAVSKDMRTLVLLGPREPGFWASVTETPEFTDGRADPLDRWSRRVIGGLADAFGGEALFPFGGPSYAPFQRWALESGRAWQSPVGLLVHDRAGLWVSYRGAIALEEPPPRQQYGTSPCQTCDEKPCLLACPVKALSAEGYDLAACHGYLDGAGRETCMLHGCDVRRSCPAGSQYGRVEAQSAFHMRQFHQ